MTHHDSKQIAVMMPMRTTVTIDPDVRVLIDRRVRESGRPFKQVLNEALRKGLSSPPSSASRTRSYRQPVFDMGRSRMDLTKASALASQLEDIEAIEKLARGR